MALYLLKLNQYSNDLAQISGYRFITDEDAVDFVINPNQFLEVNQNQWNYTKGLLDAGSTITYPISAHPPNLNDVHIQEITPLQAAKVKAYSNVAHQINQRLGSSLAIINLYKFIIADNILKDAGYFITDENRDQKYLDIVNSGVQKHIRALEEYIDVRDRMSSDLHFIINFVQFEDALEAATTRQQVKTVYDNMMEYFK